MFTSLDQKIAKPPLLLQLDKVQSTKKWLSNLLPKELALDRNSPPWSLVSVRNMISG
jgi:hypothetical protein